MEFRDLKMQYAILKSQIDVAIGKVLANANFISGSEVKVLEEQLAEYVGVKHCITCGNGTDALELALTAWNVGKGDAVFLPDFTFFATGEAPANCGATPVFVDVEKDTFNISPEALEKAIQEVLKKGELIPKVVIAVDLFGMPADYIRIKEIVKKYNLLLLEDGAQGFGGSLKKQMACSFGDISTTSFFPAKPLGCYGDGGAVFTDNDEWAALIRSLCVHGKGKDKYDNVRLGRNSRMDTIQAAILGVKLEQFRKVELEQVNQVAVWYNSMLKDIVKVPVIPERFYSNWAQYTIVCKNASEREYFQQELKKADVPTMIYYAKGMHEQKAFENNGIQIGNYDTTMYLKDRVLSLPMHPYLSKGQVEEIAQIFYRLN